MCVGERLCKSLYINLPVIATSRENLKVFFLKGGKNCMSHHRGPTGEERSLIDWLPAKEERGNLNMSHMKTLLFKWGKVYRLTLPWQSGSCLLWQLGLYLLICFWLKAFIRLPPIIKSNNFIWRGYFFNLQLLFYVSL